MAQRSLRLYLGRIKKELDQQASQVRGSSGKKIGAAQWWRETTGDRKTTTITITKVGLINALRQRLNKGLSYVNSAGVRVKVKIPVSLTLELNDAFDKFKVNAEKKFEAAGGINQAEGLPLIKFKFEEYRNQRIFSKIRTAYESALKELYDDFTNYIRQVNDLPDDVKIERASTTGKGPTKFKEAKAADTFALEHPDELPNYKLRLNDIFYKALKNIDQSNVKQALESEALGAFLEIEKLEELLEINVFIGSAVTNFVQSAKVRQEATSLEKLLRETLIKLREVPLSELSGSDSLSVAARKKAAQKLLDAFARKSNVTVINKENTKIKKSQGKTKKVIKPKVTAAKVNLSANLVKDRFPAPKGRSRNRQSLASNPLATIKALNSGLEEIVRKNMKSPALENQTGRFARSVKVTNVVSTQKGHPSYAYTYDNRYRVYETTSGSRFSSPDRDPRVLIQRSIREAAAKIAMGRFFLRRE